MICRKSLPEQDEFWVPRQEIRAGKGSGFYERLGRDLEKEGFGDFVRKLCEPYYSSGTGGRPPIDPEAYFKMLFVGFYENIGSERGVASRCEDSISIRRFLHYDITEATPDHSSLSVIRERLPLEVFQEVFSPTVRCAGQGCSSVKPSGWTAASPKPMPAWKSSPPAPTGKRCNLKVRQIALALIVLRRCSNTFATNIDFLRRNANIRRRGKPK